MPGPPCGKKSQWLRAVWRYVRITRLSERGNDRPSRFHLPDQIISSPQHWHTQSVLIIPVLSSTLHYSAPPETHRQTKQTLRAQTKSWEWTSQNDWLHNEPWATPVKEIPFSFSSVVGFKRLERKVGIDSGWCVWEYVPICLICGQVGRYITCVNAFLTLSFFLNITIVRMFFSFFFFFWK